MKRRQHARTYRIVYPVPTRRRVRGSSVLPVSVAFLVLLGAFAMGHDKIEETHEARKDAGYFGQRVAHIKKAAQAADPMAEFVARQLAEADARDRRINPPKLTDGLTEEEARSMAIIQQAKSDDWLSEISAAYYRHPEKFKGAARHQK